MPNAEPNLAPPKHLCLIRGRFQLRETTTPQDIAAAQQLRALAFRRRAGARDADRFDARCRHLLVEERETGAMIAACRVLQMPDGAALGGSYSAQSYDLAPLYHLQGPVLELGRLCLHPDHHDPDILRTLWAGLTQIVDASGSVMLMGCSSFRGTDPAPHMDALAQLRHAHLAPRTLAPRARAAEILPLPDHRPHPHTALRQMPPLLRSYLALGGWVSDHAVIDRHMNTLHVFTALMVDAIPEPRKRLLRATATPD